MKFHLYWTKVYISDCIKIQDMYHECYIQANNMMCIRVLLNIKPLYILVSVVRRKLKNFLATSDISCEKVLLYIKN